MNGEQGTARWTMDDRCARTRGGELPDGRWMTAALGRWTRNCLMEDGSRQKRRDLVEGRWKNQRSEVRGRKSEVCPSSVTPAA